MSPPERVMVEETPSIATLLPATSEMPLAALGLLHLLESRTARVGVIGLGYVGLPLAMACARAGFPVTGFDIDPAKIVQLDAGLSYIDAVASDDLARLNDEGRFAATCEFSALATCDVVVICVPTPLTHHREPDLRFVEGTAIRIAETLRPGQLVVLESTTYPGTTDEVVKPILEARGLVSGIDFFLAFSPERENPGSTQFSTVTIPKVVGGDGATATVLADEFYSRVVDRTVRVNSMRIAEACKVTENIFRSVNIALANELKVIYEAMNIDVWQVIDAAATKPFGFMPFYPGPGLGGHCIPIDPFYLTWKSKEFGINTKFIELAGEINSAMPAYVLARLERELDMRLGVSLSRARILVAGLAYKKNVSDIRESPALAILELLVARGSAVAYHDPHVAEIPVTREHASLQGRCSVPLEGMYDAVLIVTDHDAVDYEALGRLAPLVVDTRNAMDRRHLSGDHVVKA